MDLTTLAAVLFLAISMIGADTIVHAGSIVVEVTEAPKIEGEVIDQATLELEFDEQLYAIAKVGDAAGNPRLP